MKKLSFARVSNSFIHILCSLNGCVSVWSCCWLKSLSPLEDTTCQTNLLQCTSWDSCLQNTVTAFPFLIISTPTTHILALVSDIGSYSDATLTLMSFTALSNTTQIITLALVSSVCSHFHYGMTLSQWAIINHSMELAWPTFDIDNN